MVGVLGSSWIQSHAKTISNPQQPSDWKKYTLRKKCLYSELFWSAFFRIRTEYGEILRADQNNSEYGLFYAVTILVVSPKKEKSSSKFQLLEIESSKKMWHDCKLFPELTTTNRKMFFSSKMEKIKN